MKSVHISKHNDMKLFLHEDEQNKVQEYKPIYGDNLPTFTSFHLFGLVWPGFKLDFFLHTAFGVISDVLIAVIETFC